MVTVWAEQWTGLRPLGLLLVLGLFFYSLDSDQHRVVVGQKEGPERLHKEGKHANQRDNRQGGRHLVVPGFQLSFCHKSPLSSGSAGNANNGF